MRSFFLPLGLAALCIQPISVVAQTYVSDIPPAQPQPFHGQLPQLKQLTLAAALQRALQQSPDLRIAARDIEIADGGIVQAGARPNLELALLAEGLQKENRTTTLQLSQVLETGGKRPARMLAARRGYDVAVADQSSRRAEVRAAVTTAFFDVLVTQQRLQLAQAALQLSQQAAGAAAKRVAAGKISPVEETRARVAVAGSAMELDQAMAELDLARQRLAASWGSRTVDFAELAGPDTSVAVDQQAAAPLGSLAGSPQLAQARLEIDLQHAQLAMERSRRVPDLTLSLGAKRDEQAGLSQTVIGLSMPLPLLDSNRGNVLVASRKLDKARDELVALENRLALELAIAARQRQRAEADLRALRSDILPGAQSAYDAAIRGFELGKFSFLDVLDAQRTLLQHKSHYLRSLAEFYRAQADIGRLTGLDQIL
ncbi:TolC family protein [Undibacterium sp.]|uniref:TolC family protein n=1 Tax=Undibacterium sp. TaxID=1914977 RepID=UPI00374D974B